MRDGVGYVRVSKGREKMVSPEIQRREIEHFANREGIRIVKWFEDLSLTGRKFEKRAVRQIVGEIEAGEYAVVMLYQWSRWGRNATMSGVYVDAVYESGGEVRAATEDIDVSTAIGKFQRGMMFQLAEFESNMKSEQWKDTHSLRKSKGLPHSAAPRFGYDYTRDDGFTINSRQAAMVKECYERFCAGESMRSIAESVNGRGFRTTKGNPFTPTALGRMLDTGFAAGLIRERSEPSTADQSARTLASFDIWRDGAHTPIVSRELFDSYRRIRQSNAEKAPGVLAGKKTFTGLMRCAECKGRMASAFSGRHHRASWRCTNRLNDKGSCVGVSVSNRLAEAAVFEWLQLNATGGENVQEEARRIAAANAASTEVDGLRSDIARLTARGVRLVDLAADGLIGRDELKVRKASNDAEIEKASRAVADAEARITASGESRLPVFKSLVDLWERATPSEKRLMLVQVIARVEVCAGPWGPGKVRVIPKWQS